MRRVHEGPDAPEKSRSLSRAQSVAAATSLALLRDDKAARGQCEERKTRSEERTSAERRAFPYLLLCQRSPMRARIGWPKVATGVRPTSY